VWAPRPIAARRPPKTAPLSSNPNPPASAAALLYSQWLGAAISPSFPAATDVTRTGTCRHPAPVSSPDLQHLPISKSCASQGTPKDSPMKAPQTTQPSATCRRSSLVKDVARPEPKAGEFSSAQSCRTTSNQISGPSAALWLQARASRTVAVPEAVRPPFESSRRRRRYGNDRKGASS